MILNNVVAFDLIFNRTKYCFILIYRPPKTIAESLSDAHSLSDLVSYISTRNRPVFILGDLNCKNIDWSYQSCPTTPIDTIIFNSFRDNGFYQCVPCPTRGFNLLDIVCADNPILIRHIYTSPPFNNSDHDCIEFCVNYLNCSNVNNQDNTYTKFLWEEGDYIAMSNCLSQVRWSDILTTNFTADSIWSAFCDILNNAIDAFVPRKRCRVTPGRGPGRGGHCSKEIRKLRHKKLTKWRAHRANPNDTNLKIQYNKISAEYKRAVRNLEIEAECKILDANDAGQFYKFVNNKLKNKSGIGVLIDSDGRDIVGDRDKANLLNNHFASVCTARDASDSCDELLSRANKTIRSKIDNVYFDTNSILAAVRKIKSKSKLSSDPDGYPIIIIFRLINVLCLPLSLIFNSFMSLGKLPTKWKTAIVCPLYKKGSSSNPSNYRPISKTSIFCKIMERVIAHNLYNYLESNDLIDPSQHGFRPGRTTTTNLLETISDWAYDLDNNEPTTAVYFDFRSAFDTVSHKKLIFKLKFYGISGCLLDLISDFLANRTQITNVGSESSEIRKITSGVVQGSCLGPLLFIIFINDLPTVIKPPTRSRIYADDEKIYEKILSLHNELHLQNNINTVFSWSLTSDLSLSLEKCCVLHIRGRNSSFSPPPFFLGSNILDAKKSVRDLGIIVDEHLTFTEHINTIIKKAATRSVLIHKCFLSQDRNSLLKAFIVYVRPLVEYSSQIWSPHHKKYINDLESVQRRFTKRLPGLQNLNYAQRLNVLKLETLEIRRLRADLILLYKIFFGTIKTDFSKFIVHNNYTSTRGHSYKLRVPHARTDVFKFSFIRSFSVWNSLTNADFSSLNNFKNSLSKVHLHPFLTVDEPNI